MFVVQCSLFNCHLKLKKIVRRSPAALRRNPVDDFVRVHDVAGLAVDAVGGVDLQSEPAVSVVYHFINGGRTKTLTRIAKLDGATRMTDVRFQDVEVNRLVFIVFRSGSI
jgi:hypothetical protein